MNISRYITDKPLRRDQDAKGRDLFYFAQKIKTLETIITNLQQQITNMQATLGGEDLTQTLAAGNSTGGNDIVVSTGDQIIGQTNVMIGDSTGQAYYYSSVSYNFQQWDDGLGTGNTDFLLQGNGTQLFSHTAMAIQCDTGLYDFYEGTSFTGTVDFTNLTANRSYDLPNESGTLALKPSKIIDTTRGNTATINARSGRFRKQNGSGTDFTLTNNFIIDANTVVIVCFASPPGATGYDAPIVVTSPGQAVIYFKTASAAAVPANDCDINFLVLD